MKIKGKDFYTYICVFSTFITSIILIFTFLTMYQFKYMGLSFNSYTTFQGALAVTMGLWGIRFILFDKGKKRIIYSIISFLILFGIIFFMSKLVV